MLNSQFSLIIRKDLRFITGNAMLEKVAAC
jgi:hypothetical protein